MIIYKVPPNPSTLRIGIWKRIKELGALPLQQSIYIVPNRPELRQSLDKVKAEILECGGECKLLEVTSFEEDQQSEIIEEFRRLRDQEYEEIIEGCQTLMNEAERKSKAGKFAFAEIEETERRLQKLKQWFDAVVERDFFVSALQVDVSNLMKMIDTFISFSHEVLSRDEATAGSKKTSIPGPGGDSREDAKEESLLYSNDEMTEKLKEVVDRLMDGTLKVGDQHVQISGEPIALTLQYKGSRRGKSLRIGMDWQ